MTWGSDDMPACKEVEWLVLSEKLDPQQTEDFADLLATKK